MGYEIERKFLVDKVPYLNKDSKSEISQIYLAIGSSEIRIRETKKSGLTKYTLTVKKGAGVVREEHELAIDGETYSEWGADKPVLRKIRYAIPNNAFTIEVDVYKQFSLVVAEIEFSNVSEAESFVPPKWLGAEITGKIQYTNQYLWKALGDKDKVMG